MKQSFIISLSLFLFFGCTKKSDSYEGKTIESVERIETVFLSHQSDTEEKDSKIVAVVEFLPDGSIKNATQYMTYPYTIMEKEEFEFWTEPNRDMLCHLLDGLSLGHVEKNFLYGNTWPVDYVAMIDRMGHPQFPKKQDLFGSFTSAVDSEDGLPIFIKTEPGFDENKDWHIGGYEERFNYEEQRVKTYEWRHVISEKMLMELQKEKEEAEKRSSNGVKSDSKRAKIEGSSFKKVSFEYDDELLTKVIEDEREHRFQYENKRLSKSEYYIKGLLRNHRVYSYYDNGLKEKTVIFNTNNEPEYTIIYQYTFFEEP